jgi:DNA helicase-2/ATP-dependent DNA helicase PcrA
MAYLRLIHNSADVTALGRIVNTPPRRLASLEKQIREGDELTLAALEAQYPCGLKQERSRVALREFLDLMIELAAAADGATAVEIIEAVLSRTGYRDWLRRQDDADKRLANLEALQSLVRRTEAETLSEFLDEISLATDFETGTDSGGVNLSTIHAAKGLEWPVVFVTGLEDGLLPHARSLEMLEADAAAMDEELRLLYVAVTRAIDRLYLTYAQRRNQHGRPLTSEPSRFLRHLATELVASRAA